MSGGEPDVAALLDKYRIKPDNSPPDTVLANIFNHLIVGEESAKHWFCPKARHVDREAAVFLLRLAAYPKTGARDAWLAQLTTIMIDCPSCTHGLAEARVSLQTSYLRASGDLTAFWHGFDILHVEELLKVSAEGGKLLDRPGLVYQMVYHLHVFSNPQILDLLQQFPATSTFYTWPKETVPPGLMVLLMHENPNLRAWAVSQASVFPLNPINPVFITSSHRSVLLYARSAASGSSSKETDSPQFPFVNDLTFIWKAIESILSWLPTECISQDTPKSLDCRPFVYEHLSDEGSHFPGVLRCFVLLLKSMKASFWDRSGSDYPLTVFSSVKDNPAFLNLLQTPPEPDKGRKYLEWFKVFLGTLQCRPVVEEVLPRIMEFLCQELQHSRFADERPYIMKTACEVLGHVLSWSDCPKTALDNCLGIHAQIISAVAFGAAYEDIKWSASRTTARGLVRLIMNQDVKLLRDSVQSLQRHVKANSKGSKEPPGTLPSALITATKFRSEIWGSSLRSLRDFDAVVLILKYVAMISYITPLTKKSLSLEREKSSAPTLILLNTINTFIQDVAGDCLVGITNYTDYDLTVSSIFDSSPVLVQYATSLLLSPVEQLSDVAQRLVGLAFDVDERDACFRVLFRKDATSAVTGLNNFLTRFLSYSQEMSETCSLTQSLVKCSSDILDVLCGEPGGLLRDSTFLRLKDSKGVHAQLPGLWGLMVQCISAIYDYAPSWAKFVDTSKMVLWMRDALIFGRDLLAHRPVFESAFKQSNPDAAKKMVNDLFKFLPALSQWLRLTDEELLHQSFSLLQTLLEYFRDIGVKPTTDGLEKLRSRVNAARSEDPKRSRLDPYRVQQLESALSWFEDQSLQKDSEGKDNDIEIISHTIKPKVERKARAIQSSKGVAKAIKRAIVPAIQPKPKPKPQPKVSHLFSEADKALLDEASSSISVFRRTSAGSSKPLQPAGRAASSVASSSKVSSEAPSDAESSSSSEDEDGLSGLDALARKQISPVKVPKKPVERRQVKTIDIRDLQFKRLPPSARPKVQPTPPNYSQLHQAILSWNYDHTGSSPPVSNLPLTNVPDVFNNVKHYHDVFRPLLLHECWGQLMQSKDAESESQKFSCLVMGRSYVDAYLVIDAEIKESVSKDWYLAETDIVLLRTPKDKKSILAKVSHYKATPMSIQLTLRCMAKIDPGLVINSNWVLSKVYSLSTLHREFAALESIPYFDLKDSILQALVKPIPPTNSQDISSLQKQYNLNEPQAAAIQNALSTKEFVLIQGPPGTGKTSTICGLVSATLAKNKSREGTRKILVCAPSNAAIDEVCHRLDDLLGRGTVVRVGSENSINPSVRDITLNALIDAGLNAQPGAKTSTDVSLKVADLRQQLDGIKAEKFKLAAQKDAIQNNPSQMQLLQDQLARLEHRRRQISQQLNSAKDQQKSESRSMDATRRQESAKVLKRAEVICGTLSGSGHPVIEQLGFDTVIIDEAAQAIELSSLIPLKFNATRYILVGDPQQLAPTVISGKASDCKYNQSLFIRLQKQHPDATHLLSIQYRMHPDISLLPSNLFYNGRLKDGPNMVTKTQQPWHTNPRFGVYRFFNVQGTEELSGHSIKNMNEVQAAIAIYDRLRLEYRGYDFSYKIGIITMYREQLNQLKSSFRKRFGPDILKTIDFNTVDGFQGQEKDVIILSCVRAGMSTTNIGFLSDVRRMNVALTRAKSSLFILGHAATLSRSNDIWQNIVADARDRKFLVENGNAAYFRSKDPVQCPPTPKVKASPTITPPKKKQKLSNPETHVPINLIKLQSTRSPVKNRAARPSDSSQTVMASSQPEAQSSSRIVSDHPPQSLPVKPPGAGVIYERPDQSTPSGSHPDHLRPDSSTGGSRREANPPPMKKRKPNQHDIMFPKGKKQKHTR